MSYQVNMLENRPDRALIDSFAELGVSLISDANGQVWVP